MIRKRLCKARTLALVAGVMALVFGQFATPVASADDGPQGTGTVSLPVKKPTSPSVVVPSNASRVSESIPGAPLRAGPLPGAPVTPGHGPNERAAGGPNTSTQSEISMASSGSSIVITFNDFTGNGSGFVTSTDGGETFSVKASPPAPMGASPCCDPALVADQNANFYFLEIYRNDGGGNCTNSLHVSTNGGRTFGGIVGSAFSYASGTTDFPDMPHMGIDRVNLVGGQPQLYVFTRHFTSGINCPQTGTGGSLRGEVTCSTNGGSAWRAPLVLSPFTDNAHLASGSDGSVYIVGNGSGGSILLRRSTNSCNTGLSFGSPATVASGLTFSAVPGLDREFPQPYVAVDKVNPNVAYVAYSADRTAGVNDRDIFIARCTFTGTSGTCGTPVRVNDNTSGDNTSQFFPMLCVDPANTIQMSWDDRRLDPTNNRQTAIFSAAITSSLTVGTNFRVDDMTFPPTLVGGTPVYGDYNENNDACDANHLYVAWASQVSPSYITPPSNDVDVFFAVVNNVHPTALAYTGDTSADFHDPATLAATLTDTATTPPTPLAGRVLTFTLGSQSCTSAPTDGAGRGSCVIPSITQIPGSTTVSVSFAGAGQFLASSTSRAFTITREETTLVYTGDTLIANGGTAHLAAVLKEDGTVPIAGRTVTLTLGSGASAQSCPAPVITDSTGTGRCDISPVTQPLGPGTVSASFAGDAFYLPASDSKATLVFAFLASGSFVVGDQSATGAVTFWGAEWAKDNSLSGGGAPPSFKGFAHALSSTPPSCGGSWTSRPGNSSAPPDSPLPSFMAVLVSSSIDKSGPTISGNIVAIVIVKTDPGYEPNPGHAGTGTVVAVLCHL